MLGYYREWSLVVHAGECLTTLLYYAYTFLVMSAVFLPTSGEGTSYMQPAATVTYDQCAIVMWEQVVCHVLVLSGNIDMHGCMCMQAMFSFCASR